MKHIKAALIFLLSASPVLAQTDSQQNPTTTTSTVEQTPVTQTQTDGQVLPGNQPQEVQHKAEEQKPPVSHTENSQVQTTTKAETVVAKVTSWTDRVKLSGKAYLRYSFELAKNANSANQFNLDRLYLQSEFLATDNVRFQATLDAGDTRNGGNGVFFAETKYAFAEYKDFVKGMWIRGGIIPLAWVPYEEDLWGYRVQGPVAMDRAGYITSADLGVAVGGSLPAKFGNFQVNVSNGEGYKAAEIAKRKEAQARLTITPLGSMTGIASGLFVTGYAGYGFYDDAGLPTRSKFRYIGQVGLQSAPLTVAVDYAITQDANAKVKSRFTVGSDDTVKGSVLSAFAVINVGAMAPSVDGLELFGRVDLVDPDTTLADNNQTVAFGGVTWKWTKSIKSLVNYETVVYGKDVGGAGKNTPPDQRIKVQTEFKF